MRTQTIVIATLVLFGAGPALAGRGSSPGAIQSAIASGGVDAISSELERAEHLVCPGCVPMVRPLLDHPDRRVRQVAAWWLARRGLGEDLVAVMSDRLHGTDAIKARNAADVLAQLRLTDGIAPLGAVVADPAVAVETRAAAAKALGSIGDPSGLPHLGRALGAAEAPVRAAAVAGLREVRGFDDPSAAVPLLADGDEAVRAEAILTVGTVRGRVMATRAALDVVAALVQLVNNDPSARVRKKAAWALGEIGAPASLAGSTLARAAREDKDPLVRSLAAAAQSRLGR